MHAEGNAGKQAPSEPVHVFFMTAADLNTLVYRLCKLSVPKARVLFFFVNFKMPIHNDHFQSV